MKDSNIQWTDHTFNYWEGCTKVSPGCTNCYAEARNNRFHGGKNWGKGAPRLLRSETYRREPLKWNREAAQSAPARLANHLRPDGGKRRPRVFCASLSDWLDDEVPIEWLADLLKLIHDTPNLDWLLLTKRPENWRTRIGETGLTSIGRTNAMASQWYHHGIAPANVWIGTTVEDQKRADERIPELLKIPALVRFLSCEPLLEKVSLLSGFDGPQAFPLGMGISWVICGGESGSGARVFDVDWARSLRDQCATFEVPFFLKQLGANVMGREMDKWVTRIKDKKGGAMSEWPQELQIREFPTPQLVHA